MGPRGEGRVPAGRPANRTGLGPHSGVGRRSVRRRGGGLEGRLRILAVPPDRFGSAGRGTRLQADGPPPDRFGSALRRRPAQRRASRERPRRRTEDPHQSAGQVWVRGARGAYQRGARPTGQVLGPHSGVGRRSVRRRGSGLEGGPRILTDSAGQVWVRGARDAYCRRGGPANRTGLGPHSGVGRRSVGRRGSGLEGGPRILTDPPDRFGSAGGAPHQQQRPRSLGGSPAQTYWQRLR